MSIINPYEGLCIVPISRIIKETGYVSDIISIPYLDSIIKYADRKNYAVMYLSYSIGLVYYDTYIQNEIRKIPVNKVWGVVVSEQVIRACLNYSVSKVYLMNNARYRYRDLIRLMEKRGVKVVTPIQGYKENIIPKILSIL